LNLFGEGPVPEVFGQRFLMVAPSFEFPDFFRSKLREEQKSVTGLAGQGFGFSQGQVREIGE